MGLQKFGTPEPIEPERDEQQGVDAESLRREALRNPFDHHAVVDEDREPSAPEDD